MSNIFDEVDVNNSKNSSKVNVFDEVTPSSEKSSMSELVGGVLGLGALGALGAGGLGALLAGKKSIDSYREPFNVRNEYARQLVEQQKPLGLVGQPVYSLPKEYGRRIKQTKMDYGSKLNQLNIRSEQAIKVLKQRLDDFQSGVLNQSLDDTAYTIKTQSPQFFKSAYEGYEAGIDAIEMYMNEKGVNFTNKDIAKLVGDIKEKAIRNGVSESKLAELTKLEEGLAPQKIKTNQSVSFKRAKSIIKNIEKIGDKETQYITKGEWGNFLENNSPIETKEQLSLINKNYKPIAELREKLNSLSKNKFGEFDDKGIYNLLKDYVKKGQDQSSKSLLNLLKEGNDISTGIKGFGEKVKSLEQSGSKVGQLEGAIKQTGISRQVRLRQINLEAKQEIDKLTSLQNKATELVEKSKVSQKLVNARSIANKLSQENFFGLRIPKPVQNIARVGKQAIPMMGIIPQALQAFELWNLRNDPEAQYNLMLGNLLPPKGLQREIQQGRVI